MARSLIVPDASVLLKWVLPAEDEPEADRALLLRDAICEESVDALVPQLWFYEVGNTVARRFPEQAGAWLSALMKFGLAEAAPSAAWVTKILELTTRHEATFYDAAYHALAILHQGLLVTADTKYLGKAKESGCIVLLNEWQPPGRKVKR